LSASLQARLDGLLFSEDADIADVSREMTIVDVHGPGAPGAISGLELVRDDPFAMPGYSAFVANADVSDLVDLLASRGALETTLETLDVVRIEAGRPAFLVDMDEHTIPLEAGLERHAISFSKGCYVGQEVIVRIVHRGGGRVARRLVGFRLGKAEPPPAHALVIAAGKDIGRVTSAAWSPTLGETIALGYVHRDSAEAGTAVDIQGIAGPMVAQVVTLPFIDRNPRGAAQS
jgi:folate-binding protein YgfZ